MCVWPPGWRGSPYAAQCSRSDRLRTRAAAMRINNFRFAKSQGAVFRPFLSLRGSAAGLRFGARR